MVDVTFTGKCVSCPKFEPGVHRLYTNDVLYGTEVYCQNSNLCDHIERHLKETLRNE